MTPTQPMHAGHPRLPVACLATVALALAACSAANPPASPTPGASASSSESATASTGPMTTGRQIHTATLLADGRILVAGGYDSDGGDVALASAIVYDSTTDAFSPTGSLAAARGLHTATRLTDGRILIAGGGPASWVTDGPYLDTAELYDPKTGTFSPTGSMTTPRSSHTATRLSDGRVLITGGNDNRGLASAELYDPKTGEFSPTGSMTTVRGFHTATLLSNGRVLVVGGDPEPPWGDRPYLATAELYDPQTGTFSETGSMTTVRGYHTATLLTDDRVLITGGFGRIGALNDAQSLVSAELYDPKTGTFTATGSMGDGRAYPTATLLSDGRVLVVGGSPCGRVYGNCLFLASAELYDPETGTFIATGPMTDRRAYQAATLLGDGRVLVTGGYGDLGPLASAEMYDPRSGTFSPAGSGG